MQFSTAISLFTLLAVATAAPTDNKRQSGKLSTNLSPVPFLIWLGGEFFAVQTYYNGGGCTGTADSEATFNSENLCQPLSTVLGTVVSVSAISVTDAGCVSKYSPLEVSFEWLKKIQYLTFFESTTTRIPSVLREILLASSVTASRLAPLSLQPMLSALKHFIFLEPLKALKRWRDSEIGWGRELRDFTLISWTFLWWDFVLEWEMYLRIEQLSNHYFCAEPVLAAVWPIHFDTKGPQLYYKFFRPHLDPADHSQSIW
jgi:hypothetical protein